MASILVQGSPTSAEVMRIFTCLFEKDLKFDFVRAPENKLQPFGDVPIFKDGDLTLFGSRAACRYICDKYKDQRPRGLYGMGPLERASIEQWIETEGQLFDRPYSALVQQLVVFPRKGKEQNPELIKRCEEKLQKVLDLYERRLGKRQFLVGKRFTLADLSHIPSLQYLIHMTDRGDLVLSRENVCRWWKDISGRPSWKKVLRHNMALLHRSKAARRTRPRKTVAKVD